MSQTLTTERLILRPPSAQDLDGYVDFFTSDRARHVGGPLSQKMAWRMFAAEVGHWQIKGFGMWSVTLKGQDTSLGLVGGWYPADWPEREIGWLLWPTAEGRGIAFEAASAAINHAFGAWGWDTVVSYIAPENTRSIKLAERLGARLDETATYPGDAPGLVYRHPMPFDIDGDGGVEAYA